jgi:hypothetical protein
MPESRTHAARHYMPIQEAEELYDFIIMRYKFCYMYFSGFRFMNFNVRIYPDILTAFHASSHSHQCRGFSILDWLCYRGEMIQYIDIDLVTTLAFCRNYVVAHINCPFYISVLKTLCRSQLQTYFLLQVHTI